MIQKSKKRVKTVGELRADLKDSLDIQDLEIERTFPEDFSHRLVLRGFGNIESSNGILLRERVIYDLLDFRWVKPQGIGIPSYDSPIHLEIDGEAAKVDDIDSGNYFLGQDGSWYDDYLRELSSRRSQQFDVLLFGRVLEAYNNYPRNLPKYLVNGFKLEEIGENMRSLYRPKIIFNKMKHIK